MASRTASSESMVKVSKSWRKDIFNGKVVFCTGGSGDICGAQVEALVYLGANACIVGRNTAKAETVASRIRRTRPGAQVLPLGNVDVRKFEDLEAAVSKCVSKLGCIDFVIVGAAGNFQASLLNLSINAFKAVVDIDLMGSWNTVKATLPQLITSAQKKQGGGRVIFISSTLQYTGSPLNTHGVVAKSGVDALSAQVAIELGPLGITSNVIAPGAINGTEGMRRLYASASASESTKKIPSGRFGILQDVNDATVYLLSDTGSYVNGTIHVVDGAAWRVGMARIEGARDYPESVLPVATSADSRDLRSFKL